MSGIWWWVWQVALTLAAGFFFLFGVDLFKAAYRLENPFYFIMTFFASNLIILISAVLVFGFLYRMYRVMRLLKK